MEFLKLEILLAHLTDVMRGKLDIDGPLARAALSDFEKSGRPKSLGKDISIFASKVLKKFGTNLLNSRPELYGTLYHIATYMRWKTLDDLNTTAFEIFENVIQPTNQLLFSPKLKK